MKKTAKEAMSQSDWNNFFDWSLETASLNWFSKSCWTVLSMISKRRLLFVGKVLWLCKQTNKHVTWSNIDIYFKNKATRESKTSLNTLYLKCPWNEKNIMKLVQEFRFVWFLYMFNHLIYDRL